MQTAISIIIALIIFGVLVLIHEFGHFIVAKKNGVVVNEFSIGMGPRIFSVAYGLRRIVRHDEIPDPDSAYFLPVL